MFNQFKQSTGRACLTKTKGLLLAALLLAQAAVPSSVFAQTTTGQTSAIFDDSSPASWTLTVTFKSPPGDSGQFDYNNATVSSFLQLPFNISVGYSNGAPNSSFAVVNFSQNSQNGLVGATYFIPHVELLQNKLSTPIPYNNGNVDTIAGFVYPATVTVTRVNGTGSNPSTVTVEVTFSNDPVSGIASIQEQLKNSTLPTSDQKQLGSLLSAATGSAHGNPSVAIKKLNEFITDVQAFVTAGSITQIEANALIAAANLIIGNL